MEAIDEALPCLKSWRTLRSVRRPSVQSGSTAAECKSLLGSQPVRIFAATAKGERRSMAAVTDGGVGGVHVLSSKHKCFFVQVVAYVKLTSKEAQSAQVRKMQEARKSLVIIATQNELKERSRLCLKL